MAGVCISWPEFAYLQPEKLPWQCPNWVCDNTIFNPNEWVLLYSSNWTIPFLKLTYRQIDLNWSQHPTYQLYRWNPWNTTQQRHLWTHHTVPSSTINTLYHHMVPHFCLPTPSVGRNGRTAWEPEVIWGRGLGGSHGVLHSGILLIISCGPLSDVFVYRVLGRLLLQQAPSYGCGSKQCTLWECLPSGRLMITFDHTWIFIFKPSPEIDPLKHGSRIKFWSKYTQTYR